MAELFNQAPLPFQGQKRNWVKKFLNVLDEYDDGFMFVDLFGGSGLLANTVKYRFPDARVIYNDFDGYSKRLAAVENTNRILTGLREILSDYPRNMRITGIRQRRVLDFLSLESEKCFLDWITISSGLLFSMHYVANFDEISREAIYNRVRQSNIEINGYLRGVETVSMDYRELFAKYRNFQCLFIADPPYLSTDVGSYSKRDYWDLGRYLDVLTCLKDVSFVYFTSERSNLIELFNWLENEMNVKSIFSGADVASTAQLADIKNAYKDFMIHKKIKAEGLNLFWE
jgi:site-specific DNA-adenine methylase